MTRDEIILASDEVLTEYQAVLEQSGDYQLKGIFHSEMLAFCALIVALDIRHVIESGRARGQSTEIIARCIKGRDIAFDSIEFDPASTDVALAELRLKPVSNEVNILFGDAHKVLPDLLDQRPTLVLIDGPKSAGALQLAVAALRNPNVRAVCIHDVHKNAQPYRGCMEDTFPYTWFTDDRAFVDRFSSLDEVCWRAQRTAPEMRDWYPFRRGIETMLSYSATLGVIFNQGIDEQRLARASRTVDELCRDEQRKMGVVSRIATCLPPSVRGSGLFRFIRSFYYRIRGARN